VVDAGDGGKFVGRDGMVVGKDEAAGEGGGVLTGELLRSTGVIPCLPSVVISSSLPFSPDGTPPVGGFCTSGSVFSFGSGGGSLGVGRLGAGGSGRIPVCKGGLSCLTKSSVRGMTHSSLGPLRRRPCIVVCRLGSNNGGGCSCRTRASPIRFQMGFTLDRYLPRPLQLVSVIGHCLNYYVGSHELRL